MIAIHATQVNAGNLEPARRLFLAAVVAVLQIGIVFKHLFGCQVNMAFRLPQSVILAYLRRDAHRFAHAGIQFVSLAAGGLHQPALPPRRARNRRRRPLHHGSGQRPLAFGKAGKGVQAHRNAPGRFAAGRPAFRLRAGGNARRRANRSKRAARRRWTSTWAVPSEKSATSAAAPR